MPNKVTVNKCSMFYIYIFGTTFDPVVSKVARDPRDGQAYYRLLKKSSGESGW